MTIKKIAFAIILFLSFAYDCQSSHIDINFEDNSLKKQKYQKDIKLIYKENNISDTNKKLHIVHNVALIYFRHYNGNEKAIELFKKSAKAGCQKSYSALFFIYCHLITMNIDSPKNVHFIYENADMLYKGKGVKKDIYLAAYGYQYAANLNHAKAQYKLTQLYYDGHGVSQDLKKSFEFCQKAADAHIVKAQYMLGYFYERGKGVKADAQKAFKWFAKASTLESEQMILLHPEIKNIMNIVSF